MKEKKTGGRPSNKEIKQRIDLGVALILEKKKITEKSFRVEYKKRISNVMGETKTISRTTVDRDIFRILGEVRKTIPDFEFKEPRLTQTKSTVPFINPLASFESSVSEIIAIPPKYEPITLFSNTKNQFTNTNYVKTVLESMPYGLKDNNRIFLRIYFSPTAYAGIEQVVCDIYEKAPNYRPIELLSTNHFHRCAEIEFKYSELEDIVTFTYLLFSRYWVKGKKKEKK